MAKYARKAALVQSGLKTQVVFGVVACAIIAACGVFLTAEAQRQNRTDDTASARGDVPIVPGNHAVAGAGSTQSVREEILRLLADVGGHGASGPEMVGLSLQI